MNWLEKHRRKIEDILGIVFFAGLFVLCAVIVAAKAVG